MRDRRAEDAHDCVADELLDCPSVTLELVPQPVVIRRENCANVLGVEPLGASRRADEVGEDHRDDLPLFSTQCRHRDERSPALRAELGAFGVL